MLKKITGFLLMLGIIIINFGFFSPRTADAASLTVMSDTLTNLTATTVSNHVIKIHNSYWSGIWCNNYSYF